MKTTYLVKKNPNLPGAEDNWIVMSAEEFALFKLTPEGRERSKYLYQLDRYSEDDAVIHAEVDRATFDRWRSEENHSDYIIRMNKKIGYQEFSYDAITLESEDLYAEDIMQDESCDVEMEVLNKIEKLELHAAIKKLAPADQELIYIFYLAEKPMTIREYEAISGIPNQTINFRKKRAFERLKKNFVGK